MAAPGSSTTRARLNLDDSLRLVHDILDEDQSFLEYLHDENLSERDRLHHQLQTPKAPPPPSIRPEHCINDTCHELQHDLEQIESELYFYDSMKQKPSSANATGRTRRGSTALLTTGTARPTQSTRQPGPAPRARAANAPNSTIATSFDSLLAKLQRDYEHDQTAHVAAQSRIQARVVAAHKGAMVFGDLQTQPNGSLSQAVCSPTITLVHIEHIFTPGTIHRLSKIPAARLVKTTIGLYVLNKVPTDVCDLDQVVGICSHWKNSTEATRMCDTPTSWSKLPPPNQPPNPPQEPSRLRSTSMQALRVACSTAIDQKAEAAVLDGRHKQAQAVESVLERSQIRKRLAVAKLQEVCDRDTHDVVEATKAELGQEHHVRPIRAELAAVQDEWMAKRRHELNEVLVDSERRLDREKKNVAEKFQLETDVKRAALQRELEVDRASALREIEQTFQGDLEALEDRLRHVVAEELQAKRQQVATALLVREEELLQQGRTQALAIHQANEHADVAKLQDALQMGSKLRLQQVICSPL
ncbi:hypothetical protein AaE_010811 [Aphanomyces astaci]|uniref:Uncharacterized protein n=1 Tax=Aphanomyces astaci TaxID=112090 RepID=A0A6A5A2V2_APHAT|nr:hypothetical protein AaE_010811 [Aphanomyces astaci]